MAERDHSGGPGSGDSRSGGFGLEGLLRGIGDLMHQAANISSDLRHTSPEGGFHHSGSGGDSSRTGFGGDSRHAGSGGQRSTVESRMTVRNVDGEDIGTDFFGLGDLLSAVAARRAEGAERSEEKAAPPADRREPAVDVFATADAISAIVELPGAEPATLVVEVEHDMLTIGASGCGVVYAAEALLPALVAEGSRELSFRNGVLELKWRRAEPLA